MFNTKKQIKIKINTLNLVIKTRINQKYNNKQHLIIYLLRKFLIAKQNYNIYNKKSLNNSSIVSNIKSIYKKNTRI